MNRREFRRAAVFAILALAGVRAGAATAPDAPNVPDESTVLLWHLDEGAGEVAGDSAPAGRFPGAITGAAWTDGRFGKALRWGRGVGRIRVDAGATAITDQFTLEAWVKLDEQPTGKIPFWCCDVTGKLGSFCITIRPPGVLYIGVWLGATRKFLLGHTPIPLGQWTHVALVYDGAARRIGTLVNGVMDLEADAPLDAKRVGNEPGNPFCARSYSGDDQKLVGAIDEICLSRKVKLFGNDWTQHVYLHMLRYSSELLLLASVPPGMTNPPVRYRLSVTTPAGASVLDRTLPAAEARTGAVAAVPGLAAGTYRTKVTALCRDGATQTLWDRDMLFTPPDASVYDIRADGVLLRAGKPLFPLGVYHVRQKDLGVIADTALNTVNSWTSSLPPGLGAPESDGTGFVEAAAKHGLLTTVAGCALYSGDNQQRTAAHYRGSPDVLFYYVDDEPHGPGRQPPDMLNRHENWNRWDPTHPTFLLHHRPVEFVRYAPACDIFATDPYPLRDAPDEDITLVAGWTRAAVDAVCWRKPVWVALQCYTTRSTDASTRSRDEQPRLPTAAELRCMSHLALAEGARGLLYYAFDDTYYNRYGIRGVNIAREYPDFWREMVAVLAELGAHERIWTMPYASASRPTCDNPALVVQRRPYESDGKLYVLVVNPQRKPESGSVELGVPHLDATATDAFGGAPVQFRKGRAAIRLEPLQAKCLSVPLAAGRP